jgi:hypothetical protein
MKTPQQKAAETMRKKYGEDFFSKIGSHKSDSRANKGDSNRMRELAKLRWEKHRKLTKEKGEEDGRN